MHAIAALTTLLIVLGFPSIPGFPNLGFKKNVQVAAPDTLPPAWKTASRLALENEFVLSRLPKLQPTPGLKLNNDPRRLRISVDSVGVSTEPELGDVPLGLPARTDFTAFTGQLASMSFRRQWIEQSQTSLRTSAPTGTQIGESSSLTPGLSLRFPSPLPKRIQSFLGPGGPALTVSGSENIRLSGQSNWTNQQVGPLGRKNSLFPSLDMQQDLDIRLEGQLSDRVRINLLQNSGVQIPLANRLAINYKGDEDDLVQSLDLGNTNLSLPGTQYVSYSGKNEGLFGVKSSLRFGALDFTLLASKQEGRSERSSYSGGSAVQTQTLADLDYVKGLYFFLYDPNGSGSLFIPDESIKLYLDDLRYDINNGNKVRGRALVDPTIAAPDSADTVSVRGQFRLLNPGADQDYELISNFYGSLYKVIRLRTPLTGEQRLAVTYSAQPVIGTTPNASGGLDPVLGPAFPVGGDFQTTAPDTARELRMKLLRAPVSLVKPNAEGFYDTTLTMVKTRELELKNIYQLAGQNIDLGSLQLSVRKGVDDPPVTFLNTPASGDTAIPYLEAIGLDNFDETVGSNVRGHDGRVDGTRISRDARLWIDPESGTLFLYDLRPFSPRMDRPFDRLLDANLLRRVRLDGPADSANAANPLAYDKYIVQRALDSRYFIDVRFEAARAVGEINLGRSNIIEGSDVVMINGVPLVRDRDYTIDYDLGRVVLKRRLGPADQLNVDYSYAPLFQQAGRTLIGSAFKMDGRDRTFGGAFMYESKGAQDLRPRIGEEPSRSVIGDLNGDVTFHPQWMTRLVDRLPGVRTTQGSDMRVQAEVGASFPNPNTMNEVYVDDMEGVRDAVSVSMGRERWRLSSVPSVKKGAQDVLISTLPMQWNAELHWYSPPSSVEERDLKPLLTDAQGAKNKRQVLALSVPRRPRSAPDGDLDTLWCGLTYPLDNVGLDLSRAQFIELWVDDFNDYHEGVQKPRVRGRHVKLHVDLGVVSEDQQRSPDVPPNVTLDTEDQTPRDGQLSVSDKNNEDTGYDGKLDEQERAAAVPVRDLATANSTDPEGDDFQNVIESVNGVKLEDIDSRRYIFTNGTEDSKTIDPVPDGEDMNLNDILDLSEDYLEFTIDLGDSAQRYLETDVRRDFPTAGIPVDNGWRRYRIPIADSLRARFGVPDLALARHVRVWLDGIVDTDSSTAEVRRPLLMLGGLDIVGSRWQSTALTPAQDDSGTTATLNSINSVDNADVYVPPFDPGTTRSGSQELSRREQSLTLEFSRLGVDDTLEAFRTFSLDEDYSRYGTLSWYSTAYQISGYQPGVDTLWAFVRFASDELGRNFYEYKTPLRASSSPGAIRWQNVELALTTLSNLKLRPDFPTTGDIVYRTAGPIPGDSLIVKGRPSFTRLRRVSFGVINSPRGRTVEEGALWFDEIRARDIAKDRGTAQRVSVAGNVANLLSYSANWDGRSADFITVGQSRGSGNTTNLVNLAGSLSLHRFFEATGIVIPVSGSYTRNTSSPRFTAGDDVIRTGALAAASETRQETRSFSTSYSRSWSDRSNPLLRYTVGGITAGYRRNVSNGTSPSAVTNALNSSLDVGYGIAPRSLLPLRLPGTRTKLYLLPERIYWNYTTSRNEARVFQRTADGGLVPSNSSTGRTAFVNFGGDFRPVDMFHQHFEGVRNLTLGEGLNEKIGSINIGRVVMWRQNMDARYAMNRGMWLSPSFSWASLYSQDNRPELSRDLSVRAIGNGQTVSMTYGLPFDRLYAQSSPMSRPDPSDTSAAARAARAATPRTRVTLKQLLSHLGSVTTEASVNRSSAYSKLVGVPSLAYVMGLSNDPGIKSDSTGRMLPQFGNNQSLGEDWRASGRTRILLAWEATLQTLGEFSGRRTEMNRVVTRSAQSRFPDIQVDYGRVPSVLGLERIFTAPRLRTAYSRSQSKDYRGDEDTPIIISTSSGWSPLLSLDGDLQNKTRVAFKVERRVTKRDNLQLGHSIATERNTDVNLSLSRAYSRGQKVKVLTRETTVRTSINLGLTAVFSRRSGETRQADHPELKPQFPIEEDRLSLNGNGSYSFSNNVTGNLQLGFGQRRDLVKDIVNRNVRVEVRASFNF